MKDKAKFAMSLIFVSPLIMLGVVVFQGRVTAQAPDTPVSNNPTSQANSANTDAAKTEARNKRLEDRVAKSTTQLNSVQIRNLVNSCQTAQTKLKTVAERAKSVESHRTVMYKDLTSRLSTLYNRANANFEVTEFGNQLEELKSQTEVFLRTIDNYKLELSDLELVDCASKPAEFHATLEQARLTQDDLRAQSQRISSHLTENLRPLIEELKQNINNQGTSNGR